MSPRLAYAGLVAIAAVLFIAGIGTPVLIYVLLPALALGLIALTLSGR